MAEQFEYLSASAKSEILLYYTKAFKDTEIIIKQNADFSIIYQTLKMYMCLDILFLKLTLSILKQF